MKTRLSESHDRITLTVREAGLRFTWSRSHETFSAPAGFDPARAKVLARMMTPRGDETFGDAARRVQKEMEAV